MNSEVCDFKELDVDVWNVLVFDKFFKKMKPLQLLKGISYSFCNQIT
jgi:hypothetical protein